MALESKFDTLLPWVPPSASVYRGEGEGGRGDAHQGFHRPVGSQKCRRTVEAEIPEWAAERAVDA
eukprot:COSAG01_NODE_28026_length_671_cov_0.793706_1_plen_65_part_00